VPRVHRDLGRPHAPAAARPDAAGARPRVLRAGARVGRARAPRAGRCRCGISAVAAATTGSLPNQVSALRRYSRFGRGGHLLTQAAANETAWVAGRRRSPPSAFGPDHDVCRIKFGPDRAHLDLAEMLTCGHRPHPPTRTTPGFH